MNMKTIALSAIALCAANACASLSYTEATTTTFNSMLSESGFVWIGSTSGVFDTNWHVWQSADGSLNNGINQTANYARIADAARSYAWTGAAHDCKWTTLKNWLVKGRLPVEPPCEQDQAIFPLPKGGMTRVKLPSGQTVVSNLVLKARVHWEGSGEIDVLGSGGGSSLDVCDLSGTEKFAVSGSGVTVGMRGATDVPIVAGSGVTLALSRHGQKPYRSVTLESGASLIPYDWPVKIDDFVLKGDNAICFAPPRHFNKWRPIWVVHAKHLQGEAVLTTDDRAHWRQNVEKWNDGSSMMTINWKD